MNQPGLRTEFLINCIISVGRSALLVGEQGSAKTKLVNCFLKQYKTEDILVMHSNFSSTTTPQLFQKSVEGNVDRRMGGVFGPPLGKKMLIFVDDISQPEINKWGDQVTNEFFRSMIEMKGFYSLERPGDFHSVLGREKYQTLHSFSLMMVMVVPIPSLGHCRIPPVSRGCRSPSSRSWT